MTHELRPRIPRIPYVDYLSPELKAELSADELAMVRSIDVREEVTVYHGFPRIQLDMLRNQEAEDEHPES